MDRRHAFFVTARKRKQRLIRLVLHGRDFSIEQPRSRDPVAILGLLRLVELIYGRPVLDFEGVTARLAVRVREQDPIRLRVPLLIHATLGPFRVLNEHALLLDAGSWRVLRKLEARNRLLKLHDLLFGFSFFIQRELDVVCLQFGYLPLRTRLLYFLHNRRFLNDRGDIIIDVL